MTTVIASRRCNMAQPQLRVLEIGDEMDSELLTERLLLRRIRLDDIESIYEAEKESFHELRNWFWWCHPTHSRKRCSEWVASRERAWESGEEYTFLITDRNSGAVFGCVWLNSVDNAARTAALGYWVRTSATNMRIATEATRRVAHWGFEHLRMSHISIVVATANKASQRIAQKLGAKYERIEQDRIRVGDVFQDASVYLLRRGDLVTNSNQ